MKRFWICASILSAPTAALADPIGKWVVADRTAHIQISRCGKAICGKIAWSSEPGVDERNPDPKRRSRPIIGLPILNLEPAGPNLWRGTIYNAKDGQDYAASLVMTNENLLKLEGCVTGTQVCGEESWIRIR